MGSSASKPARAAASAASRRHYPKNPSPSTTISPANRQQQRHPSPQTPGPVYHSAEKASQTKTEAIDLDARDPHFAASLRSIGPVVPNPTLSNSSTFNRAQQSPSQSSSQSSTSSKTSIPSSGLPHFPSASSASSNPSIQTLTARSNLAKFAEQELESVGKKSHPGRQFLDVVTIKQILAMRDREGACPELIERHFRLKPGAVARLGQTGVVGVVR